MNSISSSTDLLKETFSLVHLAHETALAYGKKDQAKRLSPVLDDLKKIIDTSKSASNALPSTSSTLNQSDFQTLLKTVEEAQTNGGDALSIKDRNKVVLAMAAGGMQDLDIARQMGMTRDEVKTLLQLENLNKNTTGRYA